MTIPRNIGLYVSAALCLMFTACGNLKKQASAEVNMATPVGPTFSADSAFKFCEEQCAFGPRTMNSAAHDACEDWIATKFEQYGLKVTRQKTTLKGWDGTPLKSANIIASYRPEQKERMLLCAHWDSRPWADNDADEANHKKPVMAANDGASGVAVMLEIARLLATQTETTDSASSLNASLGVDFICFDAEDYGFPQWAEGDDPGDTWALGAQYWAEHPHQKDYKARFGILLDMVGGQGAMFYKEGMSVQYASAIVDKVWKAAQVVGVGSMFPTQLGGYITDDHLPVNTIAKIPCIDIIPNYPDCEQSSFGPTWHTVNDDMQHIDRNTLGAVGQTVVQVIFSEQ